MSCESDMADAMNRSAEAAEKNALVNAASIAQRQQESANQAKINRTNVRINAISFALSLTARQESRTAEDVLGEAEKFLSWLEGQATPHGDA